MYACMHVYVYVNIYIYGGSASRKDNRTETGAAARLQNKNKKINKKACSSWWRVKGLFQGGGARQPILHLAAGGPPRPTALFLDGSFAGGGQAMTPKHNRVTEGTTPRRTTLPC